MAKGKTQYPVLKGFCRWAKLSPEKMDTNEFHFDKSGGRYTLDFYFGDNDQLKKYFDSGAPVESMGNVMVKDVNHLKFGDGDPDLGIGSFRQFYKEHNANNPKYEGPPRVVDWRDGNRDPSNFWDFEAEPNIWNGSEVWVKYSIYNPGPQASIRLVSVAVIELAEASVINDDERF